MSGTLTQLLMQRCTRLLDISLDTLLSFREDKDKDINKAHMLSEKQEEMTRCFEVGRYYEVSSRFGIATIEKDAKTVIATMKEMLSNVADICSFSKSPLYEHMKFHEIRKEFIDELKEGLLKCFHDEESYGFLKLN